MADFRYRQIAEETIQITKQGYYFLDGEKIELIKDGNGDFDAVEIFDEKKLKSIQNDEDKFFEHSFFRSLDCQFCVMDSDSFEAARLVTNPLVMNFANARHPGGGFLNGAHAQEESLCRCSTLFQSLTSSKASEMYQYNVRNRSAVDSDYMLLSPNVCVFRNAEYQLLKNPYNVAVWTIPALNLYGRAGGLSHSKVDDIMKERLRKFLYAAARKGYRNLVLGAWGCGAFGHDAKVVAGYFKDLFIKEKYCEFFDQVIFAILGKGYNLDAFTEVFSGVSDYDAEGDVAEAVDGTFVELEYPMPVCNHVQEVGKENIGYTQGVTGDGIPFEAELTSISGIETIHIILPEIPEFYEEEDVDFIVCENVIGHRTTVAQVYCGILKIGMADRQKTCSLKTLQNYVDYFESVGIIHFPNHYYNGTMWFLTDIEGNDFVEIAITLTDKNTFFAKCNLHFKPFHGQRVRTKCKIINLDTTAREEKRIKELGNAITKGKQNQLDYLTELRKKCDVCNGIQSKIKMFNPGLDPELDLKLEYRCDSESIGQWTSWNGNPDAEYMIIGQDWGTKDALANFRSWQKSNSGIPYEGNSITNKNLAACVLMLNPEWDILDINGIENNKRYPLYFTNEVLCYKDEKRMNANIPTSCYQECTKRYLLEEIEIVSPKALVFLGADTFRNFVKAAGKEHFNRNIDLNAKLEDIIAEILDKEKIILYKTRSGRMIPVFPMWHTGGLGTKNAKEAYISGGGDSMKPAIEVLKNQWQKMAGLIRKMR